MKFEFTIEEKAYITSILNRLVFRSGGLNTKESRKKVERLASKLSADKPVTELSTKERSAMLNLVEGYLEIAIKSKDRHKENQEKLEHLKKVQAILESVNKKLKEDKSNGAN